MIVERKLKPTDYAFHHHDIINGSGAVSDFITHTLGSYLPFGHQFSGEVHARQRLFGPRIYNYVGPRTNLTEKVQDFEMRIPKDEYKPLGIVDTHAFHHDLDFHDIKKSYEKTKKTKADKKHHINLIHQADEKFIKGVQSPEARKADPIISRVAEYGVKTKRALEKAGILPTSWISGIGLKPEKPAKKDPAKKLRLLVAKSKGITKGNRSIKGKGKERRINTHHIISRLLKDKIISL